MLHALLKAMLDVRGRVGRGSERLDRRMPAWAWEIDVKRLNLTYTEECILGQVYGHYEAGCRDLGITTGLQSCRHGFVGSLLGRFVRPLGRLEYSLLRDAWLAEIRERTARERPRTRIPMLPCRCRTAEATLTTAANGPPSYTLTE
jgi:hypothetical protein